MWQSLFRPFSQRLGTLIGSALTTYGVTASEAESVALAVPVVLGVAIDLVIRRLY